MGNGEHSGDGVAASQGNGDQWKPEMGGKDHFGLEGAPNPNLTFRPLRFTPEDLRVRRATASYRDPDGRVMTARLVNISPSGAAFEVPAGEVLRNGQEIESFTASFEELAIYSGRVSVINQREVGGVAIAGVAFRDDYLGAERLDQASKMAASLREVEERLRDLDAVLSGAVPDEVKVLVADFRLFLNGIKLALDAVVPANASHDAEVRMVKAVEERVAPRFREFIARMNEVNKTIPPEDARIISRYMKHHAQEFLLPAPIYRQSFYKPFGYAGDFVTMNIAYTNHYQGETAYGKFLNRMFCELMISRAAISRVSYLTDLIESVARGRGDRKFRSLSIAAGPAREVEDFLVKSGPLGEMEISLFDQDAQALSFAQSRLSPLARKFDGRVSINYVNGAVKHLVKEPERHADLRDQDLVYTAGLFDYLRPQPAMMLMKNLFSMLREGGCLVVGNLAPSCDSKGFLENLVDWEIIYRTDDELLGLAGMVQPRSIRIEAEATGVNRFLVLER